MRKCVVSLLLLLAVLLVSCSQGFDMSGDSMTYDELMASKENAASVFKSAQNEYQALVNARFPNHSRSLTQDVKYGGELSVEEIITAAAWTAYYSGDESNLVKLLKDYNLYNDCMEIVERYDLDNQQRVINISSRYIEGSPRAVSADFITSNARRSGDFLLCVGGGVSSSASVLGVVIPGYWKHAGLIDHNSPPGYAVLTASNATNTYIANGSGVVGRVGYETAEKWAGADAVVALRVKNSTASQALAAVNYAKKYVGIKFGFTPSRNSDTTWYCTKLVWRAWMSQGKDLEYHTSTYWRGAWITPDDLYNDADTYYLAGDRR